MLDSILLAERYASVLERIAAAAARAGRSEDSITLVAVTKTWPAELVVAAYAVGMRHFGENRAEELAEKRPAVEAALGHVEDIIWHLIGTLQGRKTPLAAGYADVFHALDRTKIARRLSADLVVNGRSLPSFIEVNLTGEPTKSGLDMSHWGDSATQRASLRTAITELEGPQLPVIGLMTMAPWEAQADVLHRVFSSGRQLAEWARAALPARAALWLSMGMTDDYEIAIEEGATHVRIGRALFGERERER